MAFLSGIQLRPLITGGIPGCEALGLALGHWAYRSVIGDPDLPHARSLANVDMPLDGMRTIVELYSRATGIELLGSAPRTTLGQASAIGG